MNLALFVWLLLPVSGYATDIPLVGLDSQGHPVEQYVTKETYVQKMTTLLRSVEETAFPLLDKVQAPSLGAQEDRPWQLTTFSLGIALNLSLGIGPILSFGISPAFTLVFSNSDSPIIP